MKNTNPPPLIYNLFPRLFKTIDDWSKHLDSVDKMKFNAVYVNPFYEVGGSESLYAVKDYYKLNTQFLPKGAKADDFTPLKNFADECKNRNIEVYMDLVINHTANESVLVGKHPKWYKRDGNGNIMHPYAIDPANPSNVTVWGDLSEIEFMNNPDFAGMKNYWDEMIAFYQEMGINGFRCDAAYKVPKMMWSPLIENARKRNKNAKFIAESLGCTVEQTIELNGSGFDFLCNSSKWWNFESSWCLDQHSQFRHIAPSISFPESHDTTRLAADQPGTLEMQKNRYLLSAVFSKGLLMPIGFEHGATKQLNVVQSRPSDVTPPRWDLSSWISHVNAIKLDSQTLSDEGQWRACNGYDWDLLFLEKKSDDGKERVGVLINKDWHNKRIVRRDEIPYDFAGFKCVHKVFDEKSKPRENNGEIELDKSEIVLFM
ncbi:MAG: hypothetical protein LBI42_09110 [Chitinispirillales bacterium]|jgi:starch synthase (maltosyl-transferring)|nr:hypothetical protein [Chitinispirillales bacterium]